MIPSKSRISAFERPLIAVLSILNNPLTIWASESTSIKNNLLFSLQTTHDCDAHPIIKLFWFFSSKAKPLQDLPISIRYSNLSSWFSNIKKLLLISNNSLLHQMAIPQLIDS